MADDTIQNIATCKPWAVEQVLMFLRRKIDRTLFEHNREHENKEADLDNDQPEVDQGIAEQKLVILFMAHNALLYFTMLHPYISYTHV